MLMNNEESQEICGIMFVISNKENSFVPACMWNSACGRQCMLRCSATFWRHVIFTLMSC